MTATDIPIKFVNKADATVVVFTKNFAPSADEYYVAWQVLKANSTAEFVYPAKTSVGATHGGANLLGGPFETEPGSVWEIHQEDESESPTLAASDVPATSSDTIVIQNKTPASWSGQAFDTSAYKDGNLLVTQRGVQPGSQAELVLKPILYFGVAQHLSVGDVFISLEATESPTMFDLSKFPNGLEVTLVEDPFEGQYVFTGKAKEDDGGDDDGHDQNVSSCKCC